MHKLSVKSKQRPTHRILLKKLFCVCMFVRLFLSSTFRVILWMEIRHGRTKSTLTNMLSCHIISGSWDLAGLTGGHCPYQCPWNGSTCYDPHQSCPFWVRLCLIHNLNMLLFRAKGSHCCFRLYFLCDFEDDFEIARRCDRRSTVLNINNGMTRTDKGGAVGLEPCRILMVEALFKCN